MIMFEGAEADDGVAVAAAQSGLPASSRTRDNAPLARAGAYVSLAGMVLGFIGILLPHPAQFNVPALLAAQLFTLISSIGFIVFAKYVPMWMIRSGPIMGTLQASA